MTGFVYEVTTRLGIPEVFNEFVENPRFPMIVDLNRMKEFKIRWQKAKQECWCQKAKQEYFDSIWEAKYQQLVQFKNQYCHVNVPQDYDENIGQRPLGRWVANQRQGQGMTPERRSRLNDLEFVWNLRDTVE